MTPVMGMPINNTIGPAMGQGGPGNMQMQWSLSPQFIFHVNSMLQMEKKRIFQILSFEKNFFFLEYQKNRGRKIIQTNLFIWL
jgi:hypothetical protein